MKHLILFTVSVLFFVGCTTTKTITLPKQKTIKKEYTYKEIKKDEISFEDEKKFKIAIVFPSKVVGEYANNTINTILGYLLYQGVEFEIETFDSLNQETQNIRESFSKIQEKGYKRVIALYTKEALPTFLDLDETKKALVYFPLINQKDVTNRYKYFIYGAISYDKQLQEILKLSNNQNAMFFEESVLGNQLKDGYASFIDGEYIEKAVSRIDTKYKKIVEDENLNETTLVLNTPIIKSSIILSQLRAHDIKPNIILSTQLNYNPLLVSLTQFEDRVNFITANSIEPTDEVLTETLSLLNSEIKYNWVNYASLIGVNYFFSQNEEGLLKNTITNNQVDYDVTLYNSTAYGFQKIEF